MSRLRDGGARSPSGAYEVVPVAGLAPARSATTKPFGVLTTIRQLPYILLTRTHRVLGPGLLLYPSSPPLHAYHPRKWLHTRFLLRHRYRHISRPSVARNASAPTLQDGAVLPSEYIMPARHLTGLDWLTLESDAAWQPQETTNLSPRKTLMSPS